MGGNSLSLDIAEARDGTILMSVSTKTMRELTTPPAQHVEGRDGKASSGALHLATLISLKALLYKVGKSPHAPSQAILSVYGSCTFSLLSHTSSVEEYLAGIFLPQQQYNGDTVRVTTGAASAVQVFSSRCYPSFPIVMLRHQKYKMTCIIDH
jgi:hypothetical protein